MEPAEQEKAEALFSRALAESGARDPREYYRKRLRELREKDAAAYDRAVEHYRMELIPAIAAERADPRTAWLEYGRMIASALAEGRSVVLDRTGRARPFETPVPPDALVLHLPHDDRLKASPVGLPSALSPSQQAAYDLLVSGKQKIDPPSNGAE